MPLSAVARRCRKTAYGACLAALACAAPAAAQSDSGGFSPDQPPEPAADAAPVALAAPPTADLYGRPAPRVKRFVCRSACAAAFTARPGSRVRVYGSGL